MSEKTKGILCIIFSALSFAFMSLFIKLSGDIPTLQKSFFRNFVAALVAFAMLKKNHTPLKCNKESFKYVFGRAFFGTVGIFCNFYGVDHLNIADASMLNKLSPFFAIIFSFLDNSVTNRIISCPSPKASAHGYNRCNVYLKTVRQCDVIGSGTYSNGRRYGCRYGIYTSSESYRHGGKGTVYSIFLLGIFVPLFASILHI
mgnify:CR=1 FL=1